MSSHGSPTLDLDVRARRIERRVAIAAVVTAVMSPWLLQAVDPFVRITLSVATGALVAAGFWRAGWLGIKHRLARIAWLGDGRWILQMHAGQSFEAQLDTGTRRGSHFAWLRWRTSHFRSQPHSMLLVQGDLRPGELRRLLVRLGTDRLQDPNSMAFDGADAGSRPLVFAIETLRRWIAFSGAKLAGTATSIRHASSGADLPVARIRRR